MILKQLFKQPKAVFLLLGVQAWNCFSHYGMRALLLLYMIKVLKFADPVALGIYAVYCALVELGGLYGAFLADKLLGLRRAVALGGWLIGLGHLLLAVQQVFNFVPGFFIALAFIIVGCSLYSTNIATLLGNCYSQGDDRREQGFTLFYMGINAGAFVATILCGFLAESFGWEWGFGVAAIGMLIANLTLWIFRPLLEGKGEPPARVSRTMRISFLPLLAASLGIASLALVGQSFSSPLMPWIAGLGLLFLGLKLWTTEQGRRFLPALGGLTLFFAAHEQLGSSLMLFADRAASKSVMGLALPATSILSVNPLMIIGGGVLAAFILSRLKRGNIKCFLPFALAAISFGMLYLGTHFFPTMPLGLILLIVGLLSFAELFVGPSTYSTCSEIAQTHKDPKMMALVPIGFALAASLGGSISKWIAGSGAFNPVHYGNGFGLLALVLLIGGFLLSRKNRDVDTADSFKIP